MYPIIKRKILLENSVDRMNNSPNWGVLTASTFYFNIILTQNMDDMGLFSDIEYIPALESVSSTPNYTILIEKLATSGITFPFMTGGTPSLMSGITGTTQYVLRLTSTTESSNYNFGNSHITGATDSRIEDLRSYNGSVPYQIGFDMEQNNYINYLNNIISGHSRVFMIGEPTTYVFDTTDDSNMGTQSQINGLLYNDYTGKTRNVFINGKSINIPLTTIDFVGQGWNETNISLSALTKEEYLFGITALPQVQSDVLIDRGITTVMDRHLKMSEIKNLAHLVRYGNGFYKINKI